MKTLPMKIILGRDSKLTILNPAPPEPNMSVNKPVAESIVPLNFATDQSIIRATGRDTMGVSMMKVAKGVKVVAVAKAEDVEE